MSVISHLYRGELGEWCADRLTHWEDLTTRITWRTRAREPARPADGVDRQHWAQVERAAGIRLAALVQAAPPYAALLGLVHLGLVRPAGAARPELPGRLAAVFAGAVHDALDTGRASVPVREAAPTIP